MSADTAAATARNLARNLDSSSVCRQWIAALKPLQGIGREDLTVIDQAVLGFANSAAKSAYKANADMVTWSSMYNLVKTPAARPHLFLSTSLYNQIKGGGEDRWHCVAVLRIRNDWHVWTTGGVGAVENGGSVRRRELAGMKTIADGVAAANGNLIVWVAADQGQEACVRQSVEAIVALWETGQKGELDETWLTRSGLVQGRKRVTVTA